MTEQAWQILNAAVRHIDPNPAIRSDDPAVVLLSHKASELEAHLRFLITLAQVGKPTRNYVSRKAQRPDGKQYIGLA